MISEMNKRDINKNYNTKIERSIKSSLNVLELSLEKINLVHWYFIRKAMIDL